MESNLPIIAKKFWHMVRVAIFMMKKGISKSKLLSDLNVMMKRGKIVGKTLQNLMFHHSHNWASSTVSHRSHDGCHLSYTASHPNEYEFSCSDSPAYPSLRLPFHLNKRKNSNNHHYTAAMEDDESIMASPALPGFGKTPMVRQLRITDSPFPIKNVDQDRHVDDAAEEFIAKFYKDLRRQNAQV